MAARKQREQLALIGEPDPPAKPAAPRPGDAEHFRALAAKIPAGVRLGTSSWSFPGWRGIVWPDEPGWTQERCAREGLNIYASHPLLRTVGLDRSFYAPVSEAELGRYAEQLPAGYPLVCKVWEAITVEKGLAALARARHSPSEPEAFPPSNKPSHFLDIDAFFESTCKPHAAAFADHTGALVLELAAGQKLDPDRLATRLAAFLRAAVPLARGLPIVVEPRDRRLLTPALGRAIADAGAGYCLCWHPTMPSLPEQLSFADRHGLMESSEQPVVARIMLPPGQTYDARKRAMAPFDRLVDVHAEMRRHVVDMIGRAVRAGRSVLITVNNKAEGCAPLTVFALAERIAQGD